MQINLTIFHVDTLYALFDDEPFSRLTTSTPVEKKQFCGVCRTWKIVIEWKVKDICELTTIIFHSLMMVFFCRENVISQSVKVWPRHASSLNKFQFFNHTPSKVLFTASSVSFVVWKENPRNVTKHPTLANVSPRESGGEISTLQTLPSIHSRSAVSFIRVPLLFAYSSAFYHRVKV